MKPMRTILIFLAVIILLGSGFYFVMQFDPQSSKPSDITSDLYMYQTNPKNIVALSVTSQNGSYYLQKFDDKWVANSDPAIAISQDKVNTLAYQAANISAVELIEEKASNFSPYRLDKVRRSLTITLNDGTDIVVLIGSAAEDDSLCYAMIQGENNVYTKLSATCDNLIPGLDELFDQTLYRIPAEEISNISIEKAGARPISLQKNPADVVDGKTTYEWQMLSPLAKTGNEFTITESLLQVLSSMDASRVIPAPKANTDYGFNQPKAKFSVKNADGTKSYTVLIGNQNENASYAKLDDNSATIYEIPESKLSFLELNYLEFVDKTIHIENISDVLEVRLSGLGKDYTMSISESAQTYAINGKTIPQKAFKTVYEAMVGMTMDDFPPTNPGGETVAFSIVYTKANGTKNTVDFVQFDDRNYRAAVNGIGNLLVRQKKLDNFISLIEKTIAE